MCSLLCVLLDNCDFNGLPVTETTRTSPKEGLEFIEGKYRGMGIEMVPWHKNSAVAVFKRTQHIKNYMREVKEKVKEVQASG